MVNLDNIELKPCAHCGSDEVRLVRSIVNGGIYWHVECVSCGIQTLAYAEDTRENPIITAMFDAIECAVDTWNARISEPKDGE